MRLTVPEQHQLKIARRTLFELSDVGALVFGGMTKAEAVQVIERNGTKADRTRLAGSKSGSVGDDDSLLIENLARK